MAMVRRPAHAADRDALRSAARPERCRDGPRTQPIAEDPRRKFRSEPPLGVHITDRDKITFNLEFHFEQAGLSRADWNNWFSRPGQFGRDAGIARELWFFRRYALPAGPISRQLAFFCARTGRCVHPEIGVIGFANAICSTVRAGFSSLPTTICRLWKSAVSDRRTSVDATPTSAVCRRDGALWSRSHGTFDAN